MLRCNAAASHAVLGLAGCFLLRMHAACCNLDFDVCMQVMVLAIVAAGVALGIYLWTVFAPVKRNLLLAHMIIGLIIFAFLVVQACAALFIRPQPKSRYW